MENENSKWQAVAEILTSPNAWIVLLFIAFFVVLGIIAVKKGRITFKSDKITISARTLELRVIQEQLAFSKAVCHGALDDLVKMDMFKDGDIWHIKCVIEQVYDEIIEWIALNHITTDELYVNHKIAKVKALVSAELPLDGRVFDLDAYIERVLRELIAELVNIRKLYS